MKKAVNVVPTNSELNACLARSDDEKVLFDRLDAELEWPAESTGVGRSCRVLLPSRSSHSCPALPSFCVLVLYVIRHGLLGY